MWLASLSRRTREGILPTGRWHPSQIEEGVALLKRHALAGIGDETRERCFRMNITICLHRACSDQEIAGLPPSWHSALSGMAGGPIAVLWSKRVADNPASLPCEQPGRNMLSDDPDLWLPVDCGACPPCLARKAIDTRLRELGQQPGRMPAYLG